jgi:hypothetical protein
VAGWRDELHVGLSNSDSNAHSDPHTYGNIHTTAHTHFKTVADAKIEMSDPKLQARIDAALSAWNEMFARELTRKPRTIFVVSPVARLRENR